MGIGNLFKSLFGGSSGTTEETPSEPLEYKGLTIEAAPLDEGGKFRTAGYISGELNGETRRVQFIRADENSDRQAAIDHSISKARQIIDEQGAELLGKTHL
ncbi:MAG: HlyU family transcriptional regulator [Gammaproteobacteria bacterium]